MKLTRTAFALSVVLAALATPAQSQVKIGVIASATGPTAVVGLPQRNTVPLLPTKVGDLTVEYVSMDDASDPNQTVTLFKKMISEDKIDALIGPTGSPNAMSLIQFAADSGTPVLAPVGAASVAAPEYTAKPNPLIIPVPPGGGTDAIARILSEARDMPETPSRGRCCVSCASRRVRCSPAWSCHNARTRSGHCFESACPTDGASRARKRARASPSVAGAGRISVMFSPALGELGECSV